MKTVTFYISSGRKHAQYTLWEKYLDDANPTSRWAKNEWYVCNLGNDKSRALKKAKEIIKSFKADITTNDYKVIDNTSANFTLNPYGSQPVDGWDAKNLLIVSTSEVHL